MQDQTREHAPTGFTRQEKLSKEEMSPIHRCYEVYEEEPEGPQLEWCFISI